MAEVSEDWTAGERVPEGFRPVGLDLDGLQVELESGERVPTVQHREVAPGTWLVMAGPDSRGMWQVTTFGEPPADRPLVLD